MVTTVTLRHGTLNNDVVMPRIGFGVYKVPPGDTERAVRLALDAGYRSVDTATLYANERGVGQAIRGSGLAREDIFITTKLWNDDHGYESAFRAFDRSRAELGVDYIDLYLIHWPVAGKDRYVATWRAFEKLLADGSVRAIGVSNFQSAHLRRLVAETDTVPAVNQIELHPLLPQSDLRGLHAELGIITEAWSPIARGRVLTDPTIEGLARKYGKTPAQIVLGWQLRLGNVAIPKSVTPARIRENLDVFDVELTDAEVAAISALATGVRLGPDPDVYGA